MSVDQMRAAIAEVYPGGKWKRKVEKMHDDQVIAVYYKFLNNGTFEKKEKPPREKDNKPQRGLRAHAVVYDDWSTGEQISIFDKR